MNRIELVRAQIQGLSRVLDQAEIVKPAMELEGRLAELEQNLAELRMTGRGQDGVRFGARLLSKLNYLAGGLASADFRPTNQQIEVQRELEARLKKYQADLEGLFGNDLKALNELMRGRGVSNIVVRPQ